MRETISWRNLIHVRVFSNVIDYQINYAGWKHLTCWIQNNKIKSVWNILTAGVSIFNYQSMSLPPQHLNLLRAVWDHQCFWGNRSNLKMYFQQLSTYIQMSWNWNIVMSLLLSFTQIGQSCLADNNSCKDCHFLDWYVCKLYIIEYMMCKNTKNSPSKELK